MIRFGLSFALLVVLVNQKTQLLSHITSQTSHVPKSALDFGTQFSRYMKERAYYKKELTTRKS